ncbi:hypothetical protein ACIQZG_23780 [Lysinibacillus sp. NPDC096418]|uniref:hypothetical protein n=1 Tax=Lysinibacillus sp. NPDC096418 TaxID=3364138 RepID=UPI00382AA3BE
MRKIRRTIFYHTPSGKGITQTDDGEYFVLDGWNEDVYLLCYRSNYFGVRLDKENYVMKPIYEEDEFGNFDKNDFPIGYEIEK